jgi:hypothetical protein
MIKGRTILVRIHPKYRNRFGEEIYHPLNGDRPLNKLTDSYSETQHRFPEAPVFEEDKLFEKEKSERG